MLYGALFFLLLALCAGVLGLGGVAVVSAGDAEFLFVLCVAISVLFLLQEVFRPPITRH